MDKWFDEKPDRQKGHTAASAYSAEFMPDLVGKLGQEQDAKDFEDLKTYYEDQARRQFVLSRVGHAKAQAERYTPQAIKRLRPPKPGVTLVWQVEIGAFQGYFPIERTASTTAKDSQKQKTHYSRSRSYNQKRSKLQALKEIVNWLWKLHEDTKGDARF